MCKVEKGRKYYYYDSVIGIVTALVQLLCLRYSVEGYPKKMSLIRQPTIAAE